MTAAGTIPRSIKLFCVFSIIVSIVVFISNHLLPEHSDALKGSEFNFHGFNNETGLNISIIPNLVHYVLFGENELNFFSFLSIVSAIKVQKPIEIWLHSNTPILHGRYWDLIVELSHFSKVPVLIKGFSKPDLVYGQPLSSIYHASDVARLVILQKYGGIYLDCDTLILKSLYKFLKYEMVLGWPEKDYIGTQILIAHKDARLLKGWLSGYKYYKPRTWYYNAGIFPTELLQHSPHLIHRIYDLFGVQYMLDKLHGYKPWPDWAKFYSVHLLSRHPPTPHDLDELTILKLNTTFSRIAKWLLYGSNPVLKLFSEPHWINY